MVTYYIWCLLLCMESATAQEPSVAHEEVCVSSEEYKLYQVISRYRKANKLPTVAFSTALTQVAQTHVKDLVENYKHSDRCNPHSWSRKGDWTPCCYTLDHKKASCMWDKPKEIAGYKSPGYEIVFWHSNEATADEALDGWKKSAGHKQIIVNAGQWEKVTWKALGIGIYQQYAVAWFGETRDHKGAPPQCIQ